MRVAHGVVDHQVRHVVAVGRLGASLHQTLEGRWIHAVDQVLRQQRGQDRLARDADLQPDQVALGIEAARHLGHRDRMVLAVRHVLFARPHQLDRRAGHLLGHQHRLAHVVGPAAPAEAAAQHQLVDVALGHRQAAGFRRRGERRLAVLRAAPDFALVGRVERRGVHRLHGDVMLVGKAVGRLDLLGGTGDGGLGVTHLVADEGFGRVEALLEHRSDGFARNLAEVADVPFGRQRGERVAGVPVSVGHHHDGIAVDRHHLLHARHLLDLGGVEALELAADHRAGPHRGDQHAGHREVDAVDLLAGDLVERVEPLQRLAGDRPVLRILELHFLGRLELGRRGRDRAIAELVARGLVGDDAVGRIALGRRHLPLGCRRRDQHLARHGAAFADILVALADAAAATGREVLPDAVAPEVFARRRVFGGDLAPVAVQFLGHELGEARQGALAHFRAGDADDHLVVGLDHDPGVEFLGLGGLCRTVAEGNAEAQGEAAGNGGGAGDKAPATERRTTKRGLMDRHDASSPQALAAAWMASRTCW